MKKPNPMTGLNLFQTRKKSFDPTWGSRATWAALFGVAIAVSSAFVAAMVFLMSPRQVRFFNVRSANLPDLRTAPFPGEVFVTGATPMLFLGRDQVVLGTVASVVAPKRGEKESIAVAPRKNWRAGLAARGVALASLKSALPARTFVIAYDDSSQDEGDLKLAREVAAFAAELNAAFGSVGAPPPALVWGRVPGAKVRTAGSVRPAQ
jgi:hypothetical protein